MRSINILSGIEAGVNIEKINEAGRAEWNAFVGPEMRGHFFQSWEWGDFKRRSGWRPIRLAVRNNGRIIAAAQLLKWKIPLLPASILYAPRGPILDYGDTAAFDGLLSGIVSLAKSEHAAFLQIDPDIPKEHISVTNSLVERGFIAHMKYGVVGLTLPLRVFRLNVRKSDQELLSNMGHHRQYIRLSQKKGVSVKQDNSLKGLETFYAILEETSRRKNFYIHSFRYMRALYDQFSPRGNIKLFFTMFQDKPIAARLVIAFGDKCWDMYAGMLDEYHNNLRPSYLLVWEILRWTRDNGYTWFDFRGAGSPDPVSHLYGIYMFKKGFGPDHIEFIGDYYLVFSKFGFNLWNLFKLSLRCGSRIMPASFMLLRKFPVPGKVMRSATKFWRHPLPLILTGGRQLQNMADLKQNLVETVLSKYGREEELEWHARVADKGLYREEQRLVDRHFPRKGKALVIGCGGGREALALCDQGFEVTGIDHQPQMIERARKNAEERKKAVPFLIMDACRLDFTGDSFDYVLMFGSILTNIPFRQNRLAALREARRVLKPGGILMLNTPSRNSRLKYRAYFALVNAWRRWKKKWLGWTSLEEGDRFGIHVSGARSKGRAYFHMYAMDEVFNDLKEAGLMPIDYRSRKDILSGVEESRGVENDYMIYIVSKK